MDLKVYIEVLKNTEIRKKVDKIILNFFGLDNNIIITTKEISKKDITLEFFILLNEKLLFKIIVLDNKKLFKESKQFFLNFCNKKSSKKYALVLPCYWEVYYQNCKSNNYKKIFNLANIFNIQNKEQIIKYLKKI